MAREMPQEPTTQITNVGGSFSQIFAFRRGQPLGIFTNDRIDRPLRVYPFAVDTIPDSTQELTVMEQREVGIEDLRLRATDLRLDVLPQARDIFCPKLQRILEPMTLIRRHRSAYAIPRNGNLHHSVHVCVTPGEAG